MKLGAYSCVVTLCCLSLFAGNEALTWREVVSLTVSQNQSLLISRSAILQSDLSLLMTKSALSPQVSLSSSISDGGSLSYGVSGKQLIYDWHQTSEKIHQSEWQVVIAKDEYNGVSSMVLFSLRSTFVSVLKNQELIRVLNEILKRRQQNYELVSLRYEAGREHKGALMSAKVSLDQSLFDVEQAMKQFDLDRLMLSKLIGDSILSPVNVTGDFKIDELGLKKPDFDKVAETNLTIIQKKHQQELALTGISSVIAERYPQLSGTFGFSDSLNDGFGYSNDFSIGAGLSVTLSDGGRKNAELEKAKAVFNDSVIALNEARSDVRLDLENVWNELVNSIQDVRLQRQFYEAAKERSKIAEAQYSTGLLSFDSWTIIEDNLVKTQKAYIQVVGASLIAQANYCLASGGTLEDEK